MFFGTLENIKEDSKRDGIEIQRILDDYFFLENGEMKFIDLFNEDWFIDYLEEFSALVREHYDEFKINMSCDTTTKGDDFIMAIVTAKRDVSEKSKAILVDYLLDQLALNYPQYDLNMFIFEVKSEETFRRLMSGEFFSATGV